MAQEAHAYAAAVAAARPKMPIFMFIGTQKANPQPQITEAAEALLAG